MGIIAVLNISSYMNELLQLQGLLHSFSFFYRKKLFNAVHMFVHLNLAISLLLGYLTFMAGIETATGSTVSKSKLTCTECMYACMYVCHVTIIQFS